MNIALVDDEPYHLNQLDEVLRASLSELGVNADVIDTYTSADAFLSGLEPSKYDIVLLDIYMNEANGIDVARRLRAIDPEVILAFCTSSNEYAAQSYEVNARYYLQKPIAKENVLAMLNRFQLSRIERNRAIRLPDGFRTPLRQIIYTEYVNHSVCFHICGQTPRTVRASQSEIESLLLPHKSFGVINKGCVVNYAQIKAILPSAFLMQNGETIPIARRRYKEIEAAYTKYLFDKMNEEVSD